MAKIEAYGKIYTSGDVSVGLLGKQVDGVDGIVYDENRDIEPVYTMGSREPMAYIEKEDKYSSSITVKAIVLDALEKIAPQGKIQNIPAFPIGVSMLDSDAGLLKHDALISCKFKGQKREIKNDNGELVVELPLFIGGINRNA